MISANRLTTLMLAMGASFAALAQTAPAPLLQAVQQAVLTNPEVQARWHGFKAAQQEQKSVRGGFLPQIDLRASLGRGSRSTPLADYGSYRFDSARLTLNQMLFDGQFTASEVRRLGYASLTRYYELAEVSEAMALAAVQAYTDVLRYRELVQLGTDNYVEHKQSALQLEEGARAGVRRNADVEQANGRLALAESSLVVELANLHNASARYLRVVGTLPPVSLPALPEQFKLGTLPVSINALMRDGLPGNPTLNAALENVRARRQAIESRKAAWLPRLDLSASASQDSNSDGILGETRIQSLALTLDANLYRGGADKARQNQATDQTSQARDLQAQACREARQTLSVAFSDVQSLTEQQKYKDMQRLSTEKSREAYRQQFDIGQRTLLDLLDSQSEYFEASRAYIHARYNQVAAQARTLAAMGQLVAALGASRADVSDLQQAGQDRTGIDPAELCPADGTVVDTVDAIKSRQTKGPGSYVVLIPSPDGSIGRVTVQGQLGLRELTRSGQIALLDGSAVPVVVSKQQLDRDFGAAIAARPPLAQQFVLYFNRGGTQLTKASRALLPSLMAQARARKSLDIWLIGHTDTVGSASRNDALGLMRANAIARLFRKNGIKEQSLTVESYGERSPQVATPDETDEPRNRRGEVIFR
jgi:adhesin transport system outer membrane protein